MIRDDARVSSSDRVVPSETPPVVARDAGLSWGMKALLLFLNFVFLPIVGLVWYLAIRDVKPQTARSVARVTRVSVALWIALILGAMLFGLLVGASA